MSTSIFLNHMNFQIIEINAFHKIVLSEPHLAVPFKIRYGLVQPDRPGQVEPQAYLIQRPEDLVGAGVCTAVGDTGILKHMIVFEDPCP